MSHQDDDFRALEDIAARLKLQEAEVRKAAGTSTRVLFGLSRLKDILRELDAAIHKAKNNAS
jgi:hypothetical protein